MHIQTHNFFRPDEAKRETMTIRADIYNHCRLLLGRSATDCAFVPIRTMQFLGVITEEEVIFVDSQAYAVRNGEGGRIILLAWQSKNSASRDSIAEPVSIDVVHYHPGQDDTQRRLIGAFAEAMDLVLSRSQSMHEDGLAKVVSIGSVK
ncbi:MAG: hypothetical protein ABFS23_06685 [Pseudomonadota bacterium]